MRWSLGASVARHLDSQLSSVQPPAVHRLHGILSIPSVIVSDECKPSAFSAKSVSRDVHVANLAIFLEGAPQILGRGAVRQIIHFQGRHALNIRWSSPVRHDAVFSLDYLTE